jgi:hypothetical protein
MSRPGCTTAWTSHGLVDTYLLDTDDVSMENFYAIFHILDRPARELLVYQPHPFRYLFWQKPWGNPPVKQTYSEVEFSR